MSYFPPLGINNVNANQTKNNNIVNDKYILMDICEVRRGICATIHARIDDLVGTVVSVVIGTLVSISDCLFAGVALYSDTFCLSCLIS